MARKTLSLCVMLKAILRGRENFRATRLPSELAQVPFPELLPLTIAEPSTHEAVRSKLSSSQLQLLLFWQPAACPTAKTLRRAT